MYIVEVRIFGKYSEQAYAQTFDQAVDRAAALNDEGWLHIRVVDQNGVAVQLFGESGVA